MRYDLKDVNIRVTRLNGPECRPTDRGQKDQYCCRDIVNNVSISIIDREDMYLVHLKLF